MLIKRNEFIKKIINMKMTKLASGLLLFIAILFTACKKDSDLEPRLEKASVITSDAVSISENSARISGNVTDDGNANVSERGFVYGPLINPSTSTGSKLAVGSGLGSFSANLSGLESDFVYYVRAYAINSQGIAYGNQISFSTLSDAVLPTVTTSSVTDITETSATVGGDVTADGGSEILTRGVAFGTTMNPTIDNTFASATGELGTFQANLSGLNQNTTYFVRAYASNEKGIAYGNEISFTTQSAAVLPTVSTIQATNITPFSATTGGYVMEDGGSSVFERGVVYSTSGNPTTDDIKIPDIGMGTGSYFADITGLNESSTYYIRAYAINEVGIAYGNEIQITTLEDGLRPGVSHQGGVIGYIFQPGDSRYDPNETHGIIVANQTLSLSWLNGANNYISTGATSKSIGSAHYNSAVIIDKQSVYGSGNNYAAKHCSDLVAFGYDDWWLPTSNELEAIFDNRDAIGFFIDGNYWTSTETNDREAFAVWFSGASQGNQFRSNKNNEYKVRPIRYF